MLVIGYFTRKTEFMFIDNRVALQRSSLISVSLALPDHCFHSSDNYRKIVFIHLFISVKEKNSNDTKTKFKEINWKQHSLI